jgi:hypothetical protein
MYHAIYICHRLKLRKYCRKLRVPMLIHVWATGMYNRRNGCGTGNVPVTLTKEKKNDEIK